MKMFFFFFSLMNMIMLMASNKMLLIWLMMELQVYFFMYFVNFNIYIKKKKITTIQYYLYKEISSLMFLFGMVLKMKLMMLFSSFMKLVVFPFFFWLPSMISCMKKFSKVFLLTFSKVSGFILMYEVIELKKKMFYLLMVMKNILGLLGLYYSLKKMYKFLGWSSVMSNTYWFFFLMSDVNQLMMNFFLYSVMQMTMLDYLGNKKNLNQSVSYMMFILMGLPPFSLFFIKLNMMKIFSYLDLYMVFFFILLFMLQYWVYIEFFIIKMNKLKNYTMMKKKYWYSYMYMVVVLFIFFSVFMV